jgi:4-hydroxybutyrate CoA-transferase
VPTLAPGGAVTVPRTFVDYVVTEYGIATLRGKTLKERARELCSVAHPDFRPELEREASRMYGA